ncbi:hypothetical protein QTP81_07860 [Alteromonas sp. ASW11-36]|uniref:PEP-CTERM sorting domain-containing protein n=1 Tax=Alteromonas arenosi TaxID=3055817 RepID=A0ABT7SWY1_9ALTE|nr:hypothetical protein [Alteromonas sp. ASW11-36]MDM7860509.1 hypothetical protein [Alteromonas sp. ASW11-36]
MKTTIVVSLLLFASSNLFLTRTVHAALITFDNTTASTTNPYLRATKTYLEDDFLFTFLGKDTNYLDSKYVGFDGLTEFNGDVLQFGCCRYSTVTITHKDNLAFNLNSFYSGTTKSSPNDQGDLFFRATYSNGSIVDSQRFIANRRMLQTFAQLQNITSLIISRNLYDAVIENSFPVIDDLDLSLYTAPRIAALNFTPQLAISNELTEVPAMAMMLIGVLALRRRR